MTDNERRLAPANVEGHHFVRRLTPARVALGRAGGSLPTHEVLSFSLAHARARDAVHEQLDTTTLKEDLQSLGLPMLEIRSQASSMGEFLCRPDRGRRIHPDDAERLSRECRGPNHLTIVISGGLSATAVHRQVANLLRKLIPELQQSDWKIAPLCIVSHGRVAIQDEIGERTESELALILLGERPGLGSPDSLGAYLVYGPKRGNTDAKRNCVSNIRPEGLPPEDAARTLFFLLNEARHRRISGVELKDTRALPPQNPSLEH